MNDLKPVLQSIGDTFNDIGKTLAILIFFLPLYVAATVALKIIRWLEGWHGPKPPRNGNSGP